MASDAPGRALVGADRLIDGTGAPALEGWWEALPELLRLGRVLARTVGATLDEG
jgi:hypothetical protein